MLLNLSKDGITDILFQLGEGLINGFAFEALIKKLNQSDLRRCELGCSCKRAGKPLSPKEKFVLKRAFQGFAGIQDGTSNGMTRNDLESNLTDHRPG